MAYLFDPVNRVSIGDPTEKADYDQLLANGNALRVINGRVVAQGGAHAALTDWTAYARMPESFEFNLPERTDVEGLTIRIATYLKVESASGTGSICLQYWDGLVWQIVANSELTHAQTSESYLESVNIQGSLHIVQTRYRFATKVSNALYRQSGFAWVTVT